MLISVHFFLVLKGLLITNSFTHFLFCFAFQKDVLELMTFDSDSCFTDLLPIIILLSFSVLFELVI